MPLNDPMNIITTIDQRISAALGRYTAMGTVTQLDHVGRGATVTFYGSSTPIPVKRAGHVDCLPGDKVGLVKHESDWWITFSAPRRDAYQYIYTWYGVVNSYAGTTYANMPGDPSFAFTKQYNDSYFEVLIANSAFVTVNSACIEIAITVDGVDYLVNHFFINTISQHQGYTAIATMMTGVTAGDYIGTIRWKRVVGSGTMQQDTNDLHSIKITERR